MGTDWERPVIILPASALQPAKGLLPHSRTKFPRDVLHGPGGYFCWTFCPNCGTETGRVTDNEYTKFAFVLCPRCAEQWGMIAHELVEPHLEFEKAVLRAQMETYHRILSREEVARLLDDVNDPIAKLIRQGA